MKKFIKLVLVCLVLLVGFSFLNEDATLHTPCVGNTNLDSLLPMINSVLDKNLPLKSLEVSNLADGLLIKGICDKSKIKDFLDEETYKNTKYFLFFLPNEFDIELFVRTNGTLDDFSIIVQYIKIDKLSFDTNIVLKI